MRRYLTDGIWQVEYLTIVCLVYAGGLSFNDFIVAAKIDEIKVSDLQPRLRVWA